MPLAFLVAIGLSVLLFLYYGLDLLFAGGMADEFETYGLSRFRKLTGALQLLGAAGLAVGAALPLPALIALAAAGLAVQMALAVATRVRVGDPVVAMVPATVLLGVNAYIVAQALALGL